MVGGVAADANVTVSIFWEDCVVVPIIISWLYPGSFPLSLYEIYYILDLSNISISQSWLIILPHFPPWLKYSMQMTRSNICRRKSYCLGVNGFVWRKNSSLKSCSEHYLRACVQQEGVHSNSWIPVGQIVLLGSVPSCRSLPNHHAWQNINYSPLCIIGLLQLGRGGKKPGYLETLKWSSPKWDEVQGGRSPSKSKLQICSQFSFRAMFSHAHTLYRRKQRCWYIYYINI